MISMKEAASIVEKNYKNVYPSMVVDLGDKYVVEAPKFKEEVDFGDPYYYVSKDGEKHGHYSPMRELDKFIEAGKTAYKLR